MNKTVPDSLTLEEISKLARSNFDPQPIVTKRVVDINDCVLRQNNYY